MIPKEKAKEIFNKHYMAILNIDSDYSEECLISILSKNHALISIEEIINNNTHNDPLNTDIYYWLEVKQEIENL